MTFAARIGSASLFALAFALSVQPAAAAKVKTNADAQLCAEYLEDLAAYWRMAEQLGCELPQAEDGEATEAAEVEFPPIVADEAAATVAEQDFPPVVEEPAAEEAPSDFPPVEEESAPPQAESLPDDAAPVGGSSGTGSRRVSIIRSGDFSPRVVSLEETPDESAEIPDEGAEEAAGPIRAAIEERLDTLKEEARERIRDAIVTKAAEVKEKIAAKIGRNIEHAMQHHHHDHAPGLRRAAKNAVKHAMGGRHHHGGGLIGKLAQLRRR